MTLSSGTFLHALLIWSFVSALRYRRGQNFDHLGNNNNRFATSHFSTRYFGLHSHHDSLYHRLITWLHYWYQHGCTNILDTYDQRHYRRRDLNHRREVHHTRMSVVYACSRVVDLQFAFQNRGSCSLFLTFSSQRRQGTWREVSTWQ